MLLLQLYFLVDFVYTSIYLNSKIENRMKCFLCLLFVALIGFCIFQYPLTTPKSITAICDCGGIVCHNGNVVNVRAKNIDCECVSQFNINNVGPELQDMINSLCLSEATKIFQLVIKIIILLFLVVLLIFFALL